MVYSSGLVADLVNHREKVVVYQTLTIYYFVGYNAPDIVSWETPPQMQVKQLILPPLLFNGLLIPIKIKILLGKPDCVTF